MGRGVDMQKSFKALEKAGVDLKALAGFDKFCKALEDADNVYTKELVPNIKEIEKFIQLGSTGNGDKLKKLFAKKQDFQAKIKSISRDFLAYSTIVDDRKSKEKDPKKKPLYVSLESNLRTCEVLFGKNAHNICMMDNASMIKNVKAVLAHRHKKELAELEKKHAEEVKKLQAEQLYEEHIYERA